MQIALRLVVQSERTGNVGLYPMLLLNRTTRDQTPMDLITVIAWLSRGTPSPLLGRASRCFSRCRQAIRDLICLNPT